MKHPIYRNQNDRKMMEMFSKVGAEQLKEHLHPIFFNHSQGDKECDAYVNRIGTLKVIEEFGCQLIKLRDSEHWNESMSEKSIGKMSVDDILMPFPAFTIDLTNAAWSKYAYAQVVKIKKGIKFTFEVDENEGHRFHNMYFEHGKNVKDEIDSMLGLEEMMLMLDAALGTKKKGMRETVYKCISIIMFTSMFQKVTDKVENVKLVNKGSKKRNIPNHNTNVIYLSQPSYKLLGKDNTGTRKASDKTWMQKGHFRRQPYGSRATPSYKSIWIDAHWKGSGSKSVGKVYKV